MAVRSAIGLDIGTSGVRAAELSFGKGRVTLEKFGQVALPEGAVRDGEVVNAVAVAHAIRLYLWQPWRTFGAPIVWVLHAAYGWIVIYLVLRGFAALGFAGELFAVHALTVVRILNEMAQRFGTAIIVVTHDEKIIPTFKRIYHIRDGRTYEQAGEARAA